MARWDKRPLAFSFKPMSEDEYALIDENMVRGNFGSFSEMNREALKALNARLTNKPAKEATA